VRRLREAGWTLERILEEHPDLTAADVRAAEASQLRFLVGHCVPAGVARWLRAQQHEAWTAREARLHDAVDEDLIVYAHAKQAVLVTTNPDGAQLARRLRLARTVWLQVVEVDAATAMERATAWLVASRLPEGRSLRVPKNAKPVVLAPASD
jgi:predicted nuclease of predicted toxin-antitoxin system